MLNIGKAFSKTLGLEVSNGPEGALVVPLSGGTKAPMYPKPKQLKQSIQCPQRWSNSCKCASH
jgi:hypothetical protein